MKRLVHLICLALCVSLFVGGTARGDSAAPVEKGSRVFFGHYEQDNDASNGPEPVEWLVLDRKDDGSLLLISVYGLDAMPFITPLDKVVWEKCTLRKWLNQDFFSAAFTEEEKKTVQENLTDNSDKQGNEKFKKLTQSDTKDRVFILSYTEASEYLTEKDDLACFPTEYAKAQGAFVNESNGKCVWWLRSPGSYLNWATRVNHYGVLGTVQADSADVCVRPVLWVSGPDAVSVSPE